MHPMYRHSAQMPPEVLRESFIDNGYLYFKNFFPREEILKRRLAALQVLQQEEWGEQIGDLFLAKEPIHRIGCDRFFKAIQTLMKQELLHELSFYPPLLELLGLILEEPVFPHPRKMVRINYPFAMNSKDSTPAHQDIFYVRGEIDTFTVWIPLGDYTQQAGGLEVVPGSHLNGLYPTGANDEGRFQCTAAEVGLEKLEWHSADFEMGDVLIMHSLTLHKALKNHSQEFRLSLDCRFSSIHGRLNEEQLLPPYYPNIASWQELTQGWKQPERFDPPKTLGIDAASFPLQKVMEERKSIIWSQASC